MSNIQFQPPFPYPQKPTPPSTREVHARRRASLRNWGDYPRNILFFDPDDEEVFSGDWFDDHAVRPGA